MLFLRVLKKMMIRDGNHKDFHYPKVPEILVAIMKVIDCDDKIITIG